MGVSAELNSADLTFPRDIASPYRYKIKEFNDLLKLIRPNSKKR